jgi:hypothetical protein
MLPIEILLMLFDIIYTRCEIYQLKFTKKKHKKTTTPLMISNKFDILSIVKQLMSRDTLF